ncbi:Starch-binding associating with outer membrane [Catalinimonas alkaloidigena]|uniref:Starch-binding associating with outer membrane n=1 Tax=Catalinimonas alkaloidigena TaxID=1075417 RepID=A0A1G8YI00_9BACT|nr:SusD/RagB family nutrient-binding outer membrane lipoprotein [Catalinimonas alkaloidigena]SDK01805.1 Starch-binding associating with outer membrane [Catalinimonas alkaloidigena]
MKRHLIRISSLGLVGSLWLASGCTHNFDEINANPNDPVEASADLFLPYGIKSAVDLYWGTGTYSLADVGNLFAQHWARIQYTSSDQYNLSNDIIDNTWRDLYIESLPNLQEVYDLGAENGNPNYQAVAMIMRSWVFSLLTDIYGDIPYTAALEGLEGTLSPTYDAQKDVYAGMVQELKTASDMIVVGGPTVGGDILYGGDMLKWKKFANSLSLRLLNRQLGAPDPVIDVVAEMTRILTNPTQYPVFESVAEHAALNYLNAAPNNNPVNQNRLTRDDHRVSKTLVDQLKSLDDPRLAIYANLPADGGDYTGVPNGLSGSDANALGLTKTSKVGSYFTAATAPAVIMSYAELWFALAEAAHRGVAAAGDAATNYENGIRASFAQYGLTPSDAYLSSVAYQGGEAGYAQILEQKWIALYGQGMEAWTEQRRTGIPDLTPPELNVNNDVIPTRLPYPSSEEALNNAHFHEALDHQEAENNKLFKLWWAN